MNDDLIATQHEVQAANAEIVDRIANRHVPRRDGTDTVLCPVVKNDPDAELSIYEYYMVLCQRRVLKYHINCLRLRYPHMTVKEKHAMTVMLYIDFHNLQRMY